MATTKTLVHHTMERIKMEKIKMAIFQIIFNNEIIQDTVFVGWHHFLECITTDHQNIADAI